MYHVIAILSHVSASNYFFSSLRLNQRMSYKRLQNHTLYNKIFSYFDVGCDYGFQTHPGVLRVQSFRKIMSDLLIYTKLF